VKNEFVLPDRYSPDWDVFRVCAGITVQCMKEWNRAPKSKADRLELRRREYTVATFPNTEKGYYDLQSILHILEAAYDLGASEKQDEFQRVLGIK
jgi:hypothetical protein